MKKLLLLLSLLFALGTLQAQDVKPNKQKLVPFILQKDSVKGFQIFIDPANEMQFIVILDSINMTSDEIFNKLVTYFTPTVEEPNSNLDIKNRATGQIVGKKYLKEYSKSNYEFMNAAVKTTNYYSYSTYLNYQIDIKQNRIRIKFNVQRIYATVVQVPMSAAKLDYSEMIGRTAPLEPAKVLDDPKPEERYKNNSSIANNNAETKAFNELSKICLKSIDDVRKLVYKIEVNKANTSDW